ncbi:MAG: glycosyltransferase family 39 protein [Bacteroidales bacterium]|nr:glycosyltransferase family 39 protein [Bacteroidales bacterium]HOY38037.1 hypothetical protein [Bacteroidales bacterium]
MTVHFTSGIRSKWMQLTVYDKKHPVVLILLVAIPVLLWFGYLNIMNWTDGSISNGIPGLKFWLDSERYIDGATSIAHGMPLQGREIQFTGYMLLIALVQSLHLPLSVMAVIQIAIALLAAVALYDSCRLLSGSRIAGLFAAALFLCNPFIARWHIYIMTESLYTSLIVLCFWSLLRLLIRKKPVDYIVSAIFLISAMFVRPNGWILLPVFFIVYLYSFNLKKWVFIISVFATIVAFTLTMAKVPVFRSSVQITTPVENLQKGITVWGHGELSLKMPQDKDIDKTQWTSGWKYIARHPWVSFKLAAARAGYSLIHIRPYHSTAYTWHVALWVFPAYLLALIAFIGYRRKTAVYVALMIILGHLLVVALSYAEHDSRFDIYILPVFYIFAGLGLLELLKKVSSLISPKVDQAKL